jgi:hypothetical protein
MNHVSLSNDQNVKVWPWWNMWEIESRFRQNDKEGAFHLLHLVVNTIKDEKYPGLIEETLDTDGTSIGGNVFMTAAGNLLEVVAKDLMGIEPLSPGWTKLKVVPAVPEEWKDYDFTVPTPNKGFLFLNCENGNLTITVKDSQIKEIYVNDINKIKVIGSKVNTYIPVSNPPREYKVVEKKQIPAVPKGKAVLFYDSEFHSEKPDIDLENINVETLGNLSHSKYKKIIICGNSLPLFTKGGKSIKKSLENYTNKGGTIIFYGATVNTKTKEDGAGILGEQCGIIDWFQYLPARKKEQFNNWTFKPNPTNTNVEQANGLYHSSFMLDKSAEGKDIYVEIGPLVGLDSLFINGHYAARHSDMESFIRQEYPTETSYPDSHRYKMLSRMYIIKPNTKVYKEIRFGDSNKITLKLYNDRMGYGFPEKNRSNIGYITDRKEWQATDDALDGLGFANPKRKGVNYWGNEQFFNSWSTKIGLFGFTVEGSGVRFCKGTMFEDLEDLSIPVEAAYTDFPLFKPWMFEVLAYTTTKQNLLYPMTEERYPCIVRIVNSDSKGGYILINPSVANHLSGKLILGKLNEK